MSGLSEYTIVNLCVCVCVCDHVTVHVSMASYVNALIFVVCCSSGLVVVENHD